MQYSYKPSKTCSTEIKFEIEDNKIRNVKFIGGCNGNLKGIAALVEGMDCGEVTKRPVSYTHLTLPTNSRV